MRFRGRAQSHDAQDAAHRDRQDGEAEPCHLQQPATVWRRLCVVVRRGPYISFPERDRVVEVSLWQVIGWSDGMASAGLWQVIGWSDGMANVRL